MTLMNSSVASRLCQPDFKEKLELWFGRLQLRLATFACASVAARLTKPEFDTCIEMWFERLEELFVSFLSGADAVRLDVPEFCTSLDTWFSRLGRAYFLVLMRHDVVVRLVDSEYGRTLELWYTRLGVDLANFMRGEVASLLVDPEFQAKMEELWKRGDHGRIFGTVVSNRVAARFMDRDFCSAHWQEQKDGQLASFLRSHPGRALTTSQGYLNKRQFWSALLGTAFPTFMSGDFAFHGLLLDPAFHRVLEGLARTPPRQRVLCEAGVDAGRSGTAVR